jgi:hypothetical protein
MKMDKKKPYISIERGLSNEIAAIHLNMPDGLHVGVTIARTKENAAAFDYFCDKLKDGMNIL